MSWNYVERKITEALKITRGNMPRARQQIIAWAYEDNKLLYELTKPHMTGIVSHAIGHVASKKKEEQEEAKQPPKVQSVPEQNTDDEFGLEILKAIAGGGSPRFGLEQHAPRLGKKAASQDHIDAINKITGKKLDD